MKIGIFGGCFNPPHNMHKKIGMDLIEKGYLDKVIYVPTGDRYQKKDLVSAMDRYNMVSLMIEDYPNLLVSDYELMNNLTYTYQTLEYFKNIYPNDEIHFICGSDNLLQITTWVNYHYILDNFKLLVIMRNNDTIKDLIYQYPNIIESDICMDSLSSTVIRDELYKDSSSDNVCDKVLKYIKEKNLYMI